MTWNSPQDVHLLVMFHATYFVGVYILAYGYEYVFAYVVYIYMYISICLSLPLYIYHITFYLYNFAAVWALRFSTFIRMPCHRDRPGVHRS